MSDIPALITIATDGQMTVQAGNIPRPVMAAALRHLADSLDEIHKLMAAAPQCCRFGAHTSEPCHAPAVDFDNGTALCRAHFLAGAR